MPRHVRLQTLEPLCIFIPGECLLTSSPDQSARIPGRCPRLVGNYLGPGRFRPGFIDVAMGAKSVAHPGYVPLRLPCQAAILAD